MSNLTNDKIKIQYHTISSNNEEKKETIVLDKFIDETETLDGFLGDTQKLLENKGIKINIDEYKTNDNINYVGFVDFESLSKLYDKSHVFFFPSMFETTGLVALEANSHGLPTICFNNTAMSSFIVHNKTGIIIEEDYGLVLDVLKNSNHELFNQNNYKDFFKNYSGKNEVLSYLKLINNFRK